ncbi:type IV secretory system conjugative DNA transfer family protein [Undibacterium sp.]|uniref:type IV secretory system conjugative DNA transfer family protein n=1 Tax=Undibacterium sp. TaxID=1914977 RepID=UPI0037523BB3
MIQNSNNKILLNIILVVVSILLALTLCAYIAGGIFLGVYGLDFNKATPLTIYQYAYWYKDNPAAVRWLYASSTIAFLLVFVPIALIFAPAKKKLFGDAKFATKAEIKKAGLFCEDGVILGNIANKFLMYGGDSHVVVSAPTRGWKGIALVIPNLLNWRDSVVVSDMKQENFKLTSAFRALCGQKCFLFNPAATDYLTHRYNPLGYISDDVNFRIDDIQKIGNMLFPDRPGTDVIWTATPRSLFLGIVLSLLETPGKLVTLGQVLRETLIEGDGSQYFEKLIASRQKEGKPFSGDCVRALRSYTSISSDNTRSGVIGSFRSRLELWSNPIVDAATSANDFDLRDLRKKRMSVYVGITPDNLTRLRPVLNLFFQQLIDLNTRTLPSVDRTLKYKCLLVLDEFAALGKLDVIADGVSYIAGYGLRLFTIVQSPSQIVSIYGKDAAATYTQNHAAQIVFAPKRSDIEAAKNISEWLGYQTVKGVSESKSKGLFTKRTPSESTSDQRRALLLPQEVTSIGIENEIVIVENVNPIFAKKAVYFQSPAFIDRLKLASKSLQKLGRRLPTRDELEAAILKGELHTPVPLIDLAKHAAQVGQISIDVVNGAPSDESGVNTVLRSVNVSDLLDIEKLSLKDFAVDFSGIKKPSSGELDEAGLRNYADQLCVQAGLSI